jgi:hypothetical protein
VPVRQQVLLQEDQRVAPVRGLTGRGDTAIVSLVVGTALLLLT